MEPHFLLTLNPACVPGLHNWLLLWVAVEHPAQINFLFWMREGYALLGDFSGSLSSPSTVVSLHSKQVGGVLGFILGTQDPRLLIA